MILRHHNGSGANYIKMKSQLQKGSLKTSIHKEMRPQTSNIELDGLIVEYMFPDGDVYFDRYGGLHAEWE